MTSERVGLSGILLVDKPEGISSAQAVAIAKRRVGGAKVGHLGTLDPFASGLLPLCVGEGTKLAPYLNEEDKRYEGTLKLGVTTDTLDPTGAVTAEAPVPDLSRIDLASLAAELSGEVLQVPPAYSAIKRDGVPMYKLARRGESPEIEPRRVVVYALSLDVRAPDRLGLEVHCSKGTYVRALARDLGAKLGCGAILESLVRTAFGRVRLADAISLDALGQPESLASAPPGLLDVASAVGHLPALAADPPTVRALRAGQQRALAALAPPKSDTRAARVLDDAGRLVAIVIPDVGGWSIGRVFA